MMYEGFAAVYDRLMDDFDYPAWARYYLGIAGLSGRRPRLCDCACGTASLAIEWARLGCDVVGVDQSESMLAVAADKARRAGVALPLVRQDMRALQLHRPVDAVFAGCDGVNYLTSPEAVRRFFRAAARNLKPGGALAFDISTRDKLERMDGQFFGEERDDVAYLWQNRLDGRLLRMDLTFFVRQPDGLYQRFVERHEQRGHGVDEVLGWLRECGFRDGRAYGDQTTAPPAAGERRAHFVAWKDERSGGQAEA
ncbi:MAG: class I SAM-dependent methyltransferase [Clostridiales bacterium]|nr:class I SAM-dependent methyltransferase [Clostridiales bacterium]